MADREDHHDDAAEEVLMCLYESELPLSRHLLDRVFTPASFTLSIERFAIEKLCRKTSTSIFGSLSFIVSFDPFI